MNNGWPVRTLDQIATNLDRQRVPITKADRVGGEYPYCLPDVKKQKKLAANLDDLHEETQRLATIYERKIAALDDLKKSLLQQAFSGNL